MLKFIYFLMLAEVYLINFLFKHYSAKLNLLAVRQKVLKKFDSRLLYLYIRLFIFPINKKEGE